MHWPCYRSSLVILPVPLCTAGGWSPGCWYWHDSVLWWAHLHSGLLSSETLYLLFQLDDCGLGFLQGLLKVGNNSIFCPDEVHQILGITVNCLAFLLFLFEFFCEGFILLLECLKGLANLFVLPNQINVQLVKILAARSVITFLSLPFSDLVRWTAVLALYVCILAATVTHDCVL